jgi:16S rRNA (guanine527-N7)-methyltransferase
MEAARGSGIDRAMIQEVLQKAGVGSLPPEVLARFGAYLDLLMKWNARLNLTAVRTPREIVQRHFAECIAAARSLPAGIPTLLDFGSGAGFPGVPMALCRPELRVTLAESQNKKAAFLRETVRTLELSNAEVHAGRVEALERKWDAVTLRAVDKMEDACRLAADKVAPGGWLAPMTTLSAAQKLQDLLPEIAWDGFISLPGSEQRVLLLGRKR